MLLSKREREIVEIVNRNGGYGVRSLADHFKVTEVTIRRDLRKLEEHQLLQRMHGAAVPVGGSGHVDTHLAGVAEDAEVSGEDALILAPVENAASHTLKERSVRNQIPFLAESCPQAGARYIGADNYGAGLTLGKWAGRQFTERHGPETTASVLDISEFGLPNTLDRSRGFADGIRDVLGDRVVIHSVDGGGLYANAYQIAIDALRIAPGTNLIFGINDDSVLAGIQAHRDLSRPSEALMAVNVGAEGRTLLETLAGETPLVASLALFPEIVGRLSVDAIAGLWSGDEISDQIITPSALLTRENLATYYTRSEDGWTLDASSLGDMPEWAQLERKSCAGKEIAFVILHQTHEWYQNVAGSMQARAAELGIKLTVKNLKDDLEVEVKELRRRIARVAAEQVHDGETVILDAGSTTRFMANYLRQRRDLTVITNSQDVFNRLHTAPGIRLVLTGGTYMGASRSFVGTGAQLMLRDIRVDRAFIVAGGVSKDFGISSVTAEEAEVRRVMITAAREVVVLADHTVLQTESNHRVTALRDVSTVITDAGIRASQSMELSQLGLKVVVADRLPDDDQ